MRAAAGPVVVTFSLAEAGAPATVTDESTTQLIPTPVGAEQLRDTAELNPFLGLTVSWYVAVLPAFTVAAAVEGCRSKSVTESVTEAEPCTAAAVPLKVMELSLDSAAAGTATVAIVCAGPPAVVTELGLNEQLAPAGNPKQVKETGWLKPLFGATERVYVTVPPAGTEAETGAACRVKPGAASRP